MSGTMEVIDTFDHYVYRGRRRALWQRRTVVRSRNLPSTWTSWTGDATSSLSGTTEVTDTFHLNNDNEHFSFGKVYDEHFSF